MAHGAILVVAAEASAEVEALVVSAVEALAAAAPVVLGKINQMSA